MDGLGLGGLSGDAALGILLDFVPLPTGLSLLVITLVFAGLFAATGLFALGFSMPELSTITRHATIAIILTYASILSVLGFAARHGANGAVAAKTRYDGHRQQRQELAAVERSQVAEEQAAPTESKPKKIYILDAEIALGCGAFGRRTTRTCGP